MICEVCGKSVVNGFQAKIEGGLVTVCANCAAIGEVVKKIAPKQASKKTAVPEPEKKVEFDVEAAEDLVEGYAMKIKAAREKMGLKQEELAMQVNEPSSLIHRIESGRIPPSPDVARKLQKKLNVRLLMPHADANEDKSGKSGSNTLTLGDLVVVKKKK